MTACARTGDRTNVTILSSLGCGGITKRRLLGPAMLIRQRVRQGRTRDMKGNDCATKLGLRARTGGHGSIEERDGRVLWKVVTRESASRHRGQYASCHMCGPTINPSASTGV